MRTPLVYLISATVIFGCSKKPETAAPPPPVQVANPSPPTTPRGDVSIAERLADEKKLRDQADPPTVKVVAALKAAGLTLGEEEPRLGAPVGARSCSGYDAAEHLKVAI